MVVVEDVDLIAEQREYGGGEHPLLFQLLNEMDGLGEDLDITFLLTTNRARPARARSWPSGRGGWTTRRCCRCPTPTPGSGCFTSTREPGARPVRPGRGDRPDRGVTASFMKELLRRAALRAADESEHEVRPARRSGFTDAHDPAALDQLLDTRNRAHPGAARGQASAQRAGDGGDPRAASA